MKRQNNGNFIGCIIIFQLFFKATSSGVTFYYAWTKFGSVGMLRAGMA